MSTPGMTRRHLCSFVAGGVVTGSLLRAGEGKKETPRSEGEASALLEVAKLRYGKQLNDAQLQATRQALLQGLRTAESLRKVKLTAADEPAFVFHADLP